MIVLKQIKDKNTWPKHVKEYSKLSTDARQFVENIEQETGLKVTMIGTGEELIDIIDRSAIL